MTVIVADICPPDLSAIESVSPLRCSGYRGNRRGTHFRLERGFLWREQQTSGFKIAVYHCESCATGDA
jgi:hypothetical protein